MGQHKLKGLPLNLKIVIITKNSLCHIPNLEESPKTEYDAGVESLCSIKNDDDDGD